MQRTAWIYIIIVISLAIVLSTTLLKTFSAELPELKILISAIVVASLMRIFVIDAPGHRSYEGSTIVLVAAVWLFSPSEFVVIVVCSHLVEWAKERIAQSKLLRTWYVQPFNIAKTIFGGLAAYLTIDWLGVTFPVSFSGASLFAVFLVAIVYVLVNQMLLTGVLLLARGISLHYRDHIHDMAAVELPLACIGYLTAQLWYMDPYLPLFLLAPIALIYQAFQLPKIQDEAFTKLEKVNLQLTDANSSIQQLNDELFLTLAKIFDARDPYVGGHAAQVATYAVAIAEELALPPERVEIIRQSAYLHDIGKIAIPESILHKPDRLTDAEYEYIKLHANIGADFLATSRGLRHLAPFVRHHHEQWNGSGYPSGLSGEEIPLEARILALCDAVEAMASDRPYHKALSIDEIVVEVERCAGGQFDPAIVSAFLQIVQERKESLVVNSARAVTLQYTQAADVQEQPFFPQLVEIYKTVSA